MQKAGNQRILLTLTLTVVLMVVAAFFYPNHHSDDVSSHDAALSGLPIRVGDSFWPGTYWQLIAQNKGWFAEAGLNIELVDIGADYFGSLRDMVAGKLDSNNLTLFDLINFRLDGADLVGVLYTDDSQGIDAIIARADIKSLSKIKGRRIGVDLSSYQEYILHEALQAAGVDSSSVIKVPNQAEQAAAMLAAGTVDAALSWEPVVSQALALEGMHKLYDTSQTPGISPALGVFSQRFIDARRADVQAFVAVWQRTNAFIHDHPEAAYAIIAEARDVDVEEVAQLARLDIIQSLRDNQDGFSIGAGAGSLHGRARRINDFLLENGLTEMYLDTLDLLDDRFIRAVKPLKVK